LATARRTTSATASTARIRGGAVAPLQPADPEAPIRAVLVGEAPGPRGADQSGIPFFGDRAGRPLYAALLAAGALQWIGDPGSVAWDGAALLSAGVRPVVSGVLLTNAFDRCPTDDGQHFRAPTRAEREHPENLARLRRDITYATARGADRIICLGKVAARVVDRADSPLTVFAVPHPSAQGLLTSAPDRGKGARMSDLEAAWIASLAALITRE
jgi:uracil-DNA glycosylase